MISYIFGYLPVFPFIQALVNLVVKTVLGIKLVKFAGEIIAEISKRIVLLRRES